MDKKKLRAAYMREYRKRRKAIENATCVSSRKRIRKTNKERTREFRERQRKHQIYYLREVLGMSLGHKIKMTGMSAKEKQRAYRKCKEAREGKKPKKFPKTGAERSREWRARKKVLAQAVLHTAEPSQPFKVMQSLRPHHIRRIVRDSKNKRNSSRPNETHPANSFHYEQVKVENLEAFPSSGCETLVNIKSEDDISSDNNVQIKCEPNFDGENDPLNANDLSSNYEGEINCQMNSSCDDDPLSTRNTSLNEECEINYQVSVKNEVDPLNTLDMSLTDEVKIECQSNSDYEDDQWCRQSNCNEGVRVKEEKKDSGESAIS